MNTGNVYRELGWRYSILMDSQVHLDVLCKYTPHSDLSLVSKTYLCHFIIGEVISQKDESDRYRMLLQALVAARVGRYLMKSDKTPFILMALYLKKDLTVERYLLSQTGENLSVCAFGQTPSFNLNILPVGAYCAARF